MLGWLSRTTLNRARLSLIGRKPAGYIGWLGHGNLGDEAAFQAVRGLLSGTPLVHYRGVRRERYLTQVGLSGQTALRAAILGGGTLINPGYLGIARRAISDGLPLFAFGTGVGSCGFCEDPNPTLAGWGEVLDAARLLGVRGPRSKATLEALGVGRVEVVGDPALSLACRQVPAKRTRPRLAVNLTMARGEEYGYCETACREVAAIARDFMRAGGEVVPIALGERDGEALRQLLRETGLDSSSVIQCRYSPQKFFQFVAGSEALIGVRLHSAVLACCCGVPPVLISYRTKCDDFMESMGLEAYAVPRGRDSAELLRTAFYRILDDGSVSQRILDRAHAWQSVQRTFAHRLLDDLAKGRRLTANEVGSIHFQH